MKTIEILPLIHREMKRNHFSKADMARKLNAHPATIQGMFSRRTMQIQKLVKLSEIFRYNFFREIAEMLPYKDPDYSEKTTVDTEKEEMKERIKALEMEVGILRQTLKDVVAR